MEQKKYIERTAYHMLPAEYEKRKIKELLILNSYCPYGESLRDIDKNNEVLYVINPRKDSYAMQTVRTENREDKKKN